MSLVKNYVIFLIFIKRNIKNNEIINHLMKIYNFKPNENKILSVINISAKLFATN